MPAPRLVRIIILLPKRHRGMSSPLWVVYDLRPNKDHDPFQLCCYTKSLEYAEDAVEEYAYQTLCQLTGVYNADALDDDRPLSEVGPGYFMRYDDEAIYPRINVWHVQRNVEPIHVAQFGVTYVNKWKEDYLDEVTPAVQRLAADDTVSGAVYSSNRPDGRVARFLRGEGNYRSSSDEE